MKGYCKSCEKNVYLIPGDGIWACPVCGYGVKPYIGSGNYPHKKRSQGGSSA
jgi:ribosomal protein L37AE/L43A